MVGEKEIEDMILLSAHFQDELSTLWRPWMSNEVKDSQDEKLSKLIPNIGEKMNILKLVRFLKIFINSFTHIYTIY